MTTVLPLWVDLLTAALVVTGSIVVLLGALGLLRFETFFQRAHAPTLGTTVGTWGVALATVVQFSALQERISLSALLIPVFIAVTMPITTIFLMRAALFRDRLAGRPVPPHITPQTPGPPGDESSARGEDEGQASRT